MIQKLFEIIAASKKIVTVDKTNNNFLLKLKCEYLTIKTENSVPPIVNDTFAPVPRLKILSKLLTKLSLGIKLLLFIRHNTMNPKKNKRILNALSRTKRYIKLHTK